MARSTLAKVLVRLHVEPHREECELAARDEEQRDQHDRRRRDRVAAETTDRLEDAEDEPDGGHDESEEVEEDERVEVADDVLLAHPPEEPLPEEPRDPRHDSADPDP